jgi:RNA polymerase sigma-70 factor (ECF subfamily)
MRALLQRSSSHQQPPAAALAGASPSAVDDRTLVARARVDAQAFAALYERYVDGVYWYCFGHLGEAAAAEDATSQVFINVLAALPRYRDQEHATAFRSWLFRIAHNVVVDHVRARRCHAPLATIIDVVDGAALPEEVVLRDEARHGLWELVAALPPEQRSVVVLRLLGLSGAEIAIALGRSLGAIRTAQSRAVVRLRNMLHANAVPDGSGVVRDGSRCHGA